MEDNYYTLEGMHYKDNKPVRIIIKDGFIESMEPLAALEDSELYIAPGFVDLQVNGYRGVDFNSIELTVDDVRKACLFLLEEGATSFFPTIITNSFNQIASLTSTISLAREQDELVRSMIPGIHLEGPFLSGEDGPRGAHSKQYIQPPDFEFFQALNESVNGLIKMITLSPEWPDAADFIKKAAAHQVLVSIGHTAADGEQIREAVKAGAALSTHLGNGAHVMLPRHPNYLWDQLAEDSLAATVICDGYHLPSSVLKVIEKVKEDKMLIISDSVALAGLPPGDYTAPVGGEVTLTEQGKLHLKNEPKLLAGSAQSILWGVNTLTSMGITALEKAIEKASILPAKLLNLPQKDGLQAGAPADLLLFRKENGRMELIKAIKMGDPGPINQ
ncbi:MULTISPECIES: N-acetylglucosamine-6-phosphate deacetylase [Bacillus]|uniref:N-acetylglucosamine-6-phosphate deacetylase n=1 Tax=Bacillus infantis NRRL B-14911 TaxID=1367477 RepID=U5LIA3_9BACI|nr:MULTISPECIES: amidohydrolase family protein [Bacillus]AGX06416.1 N-acetylglucosamine-6-phosphate deacetylase [Bacillus infantis NRRL B-14911]